MAKHTVFKSVLLNRAANGYTHYIKERKDDKLQTYIDLVILQDYLHPSVLVSHILHSPHAVRKSLSQEFSHAVFLLFFRKYVLDFPIKNSTLLKVSNKI